MQMTTEAPFTPPKKKPSVILRKVNGTYELSVAALRVPEHNARKKSFDRFESGVAVEQRDVHNPFRSNARPKFTIAGD
jgi:hypothetical protein